MQCNTEATPSSASSIDTEDHNDAIEVQSEENIYKSQRNWSQLDFTFNDTDEDYEEDTIEDEAIDVWFDVRDICYYYTKFNFLFNCKGENKFQYSIFNQKCLPPWKVRFL